MLIRYAQTSTIEQVAGLEAQEAALAATGCTKVFREQASSVGQRDQLAAVLDWMREGDTLVVAWLDRLARSTADLLGIVALLGARAGGVAGARLRGQRDGHAFVHQPEFGERDDDDAGELRSGGRDRAARRATTPMRGRSRCAALTPIM